MLYSLQMIAMLPTISSTSYGKRPTIQGPLSLAPHPRPAGQGVAPSHMPSDVASADDVGDLEDMRGAGEAGASEAAGCNAGEGGEKKGMRSTARIERTHSAWSRVQKVIENVGLDKDSNPQAILVYTL